MFTLSYDDGAVQDKKFIEIINKYGMKGTFNLNSSRITNTPNDLYLTKDEMLKYYQGHEVAVHTCTHPGLEGLSEEIIYSEIVDDKVQLENIFGYSVSGIAYPFGTYDEIVKRVAKKCGIAYARTVISTHDFKQPKDFLEWHFTCHHKDGELMRLAEKFCNTEQDDALSVFSVWGHSYEFDGDQNWEVLEELCAYLSKHDDIYFATNMEVYNALKSND